MDDDAPAAVAPSRRIDAIDAVRGAALLGVAVVNVLTAFRVSFFQQFLPRQPIDAGIDGMVERFVAFAVEEKAFSLFSILFGLGLAMQLERFSRSGRPFVLLTRRILALLVFGGVHLFLIWNGDILVEYAVAGFVVLPLLRLSRERLAAIAAGALVAYATLSLFPPLVALPDAAALAEHIERANAVYAHGSFVEILRFSVREIAMIVPLHVSVFPRTVGLFVLGAWIWRTGAIQHVRDNVEVFTAAATVGILIGVTLMASSNPFLHRLAPEVLAAGYGSLLFRIAQVDGSRRILAPFASVGRMALTNYVLQSVIFGFVFMGYGFGLFGSVGAGAALLLVLVVFALQAVLSAVWLRNFQFGPLEWLWRTITYGRAQPLRAVRPGEHGRPSRAGSVEAP